MRSLTFTPRTTFILTRHGIDFKESLNTHIWKGVSPRPCYCNPSIMNFFKKNLLFQQLSLVFTLLSRWLTTQTDKTMSNSHCTTIKQSSWLSNIKCFAITFSSFSLKTCSTTVICVHNYWFMIYISEFIFCTFMQLRKSAHVHKRSLQHKHCCMSSTSLMLSEGNICLYSICAKH